MTSLKTMIEYLLFYWLIGAILIFFYRGEVKIACLAIAILIGSMLIRSWKKPRKQ